MTNNHPFLSGYVDDFCVLNKFVNDPASLTLLRSHGCSHPSFASSVEYYVNFDDPDNLNYLPGTIHDEEDTNLPSIVPSNCPVLASGDLVSIQFYFISC